MVQAQWRRVSSSQISPGTEIRFYSRPMRFDMICDAHGLEHRLTKPNHPWTSGQLERMNRTVQEATVKRFHYQDHQQLRAHLGDYMAAYNYARKLKTLNGLAPYEYICKTGLHRRKDSSSIRSTRCRDSTSRGPRFGDLPVADE